MKLKNIKIVFIDIDGTLINSNKEVTEKTKTAIKNTLDKNIMVVICSGRCLPSALRIREKANASKYIITNNGSEIYDCNDDKYIYKNVLKDDDIAFIWNYCLSNNLGCILNSRHHQYCNINILLNQPFQVPIQSLEELDNIDISQIIIISHNLEKIQQLELLINDKLEITNKSKSYDLKIPDASYYSFDITNKNINKGSGIKQLLNYLNINKENCVGFGNGINDILLFREVGYKVAVANAHEKLKKEADFITQSNNDDGVAYFLNNNIE